MTALVDVVFILTLFFLLSSTFGVWQATSIELAGDAVEPGGAQMGEGARNPRPVLIAIRQRGDTLDMNVIVNGVPVGHDRLTESVKRFVDMGIREALVRPSANIDFQSIVSVMDAVKRAGLSHVRLSLE